MLHLEVRVVNGYCINRCNCLFLFVLESSPSLHKRHVTTLADVADEKRDVAMTTNGYDDYEPELSHAERMNYLHEKPFWKKFVNINAVLVMTVTVFLFGFFY